MEQNFKRSMMLSALAFAAASSDQALYLNPNDYKKPKRYINGNGTRSRAENKKRRAKRRRVKASRKQNRK